MYGDPKLVRVHVVQVSLNEYENAEVDKIVAKTGRSRATVLRELMMAEAYRQNMGVDAPKSSAKLEALTSQVKGVGKQQCQGEQSIAYR